MPSPALVGVMPVTQTSFPLGRSARRSSAVSEILLLYRPYGSISSGSSPSLSPISSIGSSSASCAISRLDFISYVLSLVGQCETAAAPTSETRRSR